MDQVVVIKLERNIGGNGSAIELNSQEKDK